MPKFDLEVRLTGTNGNVYVLMAACAVAMKKAMRTHPELGITYDIITEFRNAVMASGSYDEALNVMQTWLDIC